MKQIGDPKTRSDRNAWGGYSDVTHTQYEIEPRDVGLLKQNYQGHKHAEYRFVSTDVGRKIDWMSQPSGWNCWSFIS